MRDRVELSEADLHDHIRNRMAQRGITSNEIERVLNEGWDAADAKPGTAGEVLVIRYEQEWEGVTRAEKEVTVSYRLAAPRIILLTAVQDMAADSRGGESP